MAPALGLLLSAAAAAAAEPVPRCSPGKPYLSGMHELKMHLAGLPRRALLFVPPGYRADAGLPLIIVPQAFGWSAEFNIQHTKLIPQAIRRNFSLLQLDAPGLAINVALDGRANPARPDDVAYTSAMLNEGDRALCLDARRIFCVGFSRGARFCSRLASERSDIVAAIVALSGVRFPRPNNATRPMPVLAFHGTADAVNPYPGGGPPYWQTSVADAISGWVDFNGCQRHSSWEVGSRQQVEAYSSCRENAEVVLQQTKGGGHDWPDASYPVSGYPLHAPQANDIILDFLMEHPLPTELNQRVPVEGPAAFSVTSSVVEDPAPHEQHVGAGENVSVSTKAPQGRAASRASATTSAADARRAQRNDSAGRHRESSKKLLGAWERATAIHGGPSTTRPPPEAFRHAAVPAAALGLMFASLVLLAFGSRGGGARRWRGCSDPGAFAAAEGAAAGGASAGAEWMHLLS
uniref:Feruloyl esterase n=1 Tax=Alexandrium monilatum TaxID=311494 RepID=A0A7S4QL46_9DINO